MNASHTPPVSIILPVFNAGAFLIKMLQTIAQQTLQCFELVIVNDGSTDDSAETIKRFACSVGFPVRVIEHDSNLGLNASINSGIREARGNFLALADHDDMWHPEKVAVMLHWLEHNPGTACCFSDRALIDEYDRLILCSEYRLLKYRTTRIGLSDALTSKVRHSSNTLFVRNFGWSSLEIPKSVVEHDRYLLVCAALHGAVDYIHRALVYYRIHTNNLSGNYSYLVHYSYGHFIKSFQRVLQRRDQSRRNDVAEINALLTRHGYALTCKSREQRIADRNGPINYFRRVIIRNARRLWINCTRAGQEFSFRANQKNYTLFRKASKL